MSSSRNKKNPDEINQPGNWIGYSIISGIGLLISIGVGYYLISKVHNLVKYSVFSQAYYVLLVLLSLAVASFIFGAMRASARLKGKQSDVAWELGGPAVAVALIVVGGFWLPPEAPKSRFRKS